MVTDASGRRQPVGRLAAGTDAVWTQTPEDERLWRVPLAGGPARAVRVPGIGYGLATDAGELVGPIPRGTFASGDWRRDSGMPSIGVRARVEAHRMATGPLLGRGKDAESIEDNRIISPTDTRGA